MSRSTRAAPAPPQPYLYRATLSFERVGARRRTERPPLRVEIEIASNDPLRITLADMAMEVLAVEWRPPGHPDPQRHPTRERPFRGWEAKVSDRDPLIPLEASQVAHLVGHLRWVEAGISYPRVVGEEITSTQLRQETLMREIVKDWETVNSTIEKGYSVSSDIHDTVASLSETENRDLYTQAHRLLSHSQSDLSHRTINGTKEPSVLETRLRTAHQHAVLRGDNRISELMTLWRYAYRTLSTYQTELMSLRYRLGIRQ